MFGVWLVTDKRIYFKEFVQNVKYTGGFDDPADQMMLLRKF